MKRSRREKVSQVQLDIWAWQDAALDCCQNLMALGELVELADDHANPPTITRAGWMIHQEARKLQAKLEALRVLLPKAE